MVHTDTPATSIPQDQDRLNKFASVQADPEVLALVEQKYQHFEDLNRQLSENQEKRRDLLDQLSRVNDTIQHLTDEISRLSGKAATEIVSSLDKVAGGTELNRSSAGSESKPVSGGSMAATGAEPTDTGQSAASKPDEPATPESEAEAFTAPATDTHRISWDWPTNTADDQTVPASSAEVAPVDAPQTNSATPAEQPAQEAQASPAPPAEMPVTTQPEPVSAPSAEQADAPTNHDDAKLEQPAAAQPTGDQNSSSTNSSAPVPSEVHELQRIFDEAEPARRQTDSALKLVQLYDGQAEAFYQAMCRSHQQNGLSEEEARKEATKDVQTMIATAKVQQGQSSKEKNGKGGGVKRLFSH